MKHNLVLYFRNLRKEKTRLLNILSIAITLTFALLIMFFLEDELSFDRWNNNLKDIFRVETSDKWPAKKFDRATSTICTGPLLKSEFPEVKSFVRFINIRSPKVFIEDKEFNEKQFYYTDSSIFEIFPYELIAGKDFYFDSKHNAVEPLIIGLAKEGGNTPFISVKIAPDKIKSTIQILQDQWSNFSPGSPFNYSFVEEIIEAFYVNEERLNKIFKWGRNIVIFNRVFWINLF